MKTKEQLLKEKAEIERQLEDLGKRGYTIRNRLDNSEIFVSTKDNVRDAVLEALEQGVSLSGANLWGANLWGADLRGADLRGADLRGANLGEAKFYGKGDTQKLKKSQVEDFLNALGFQIED